MLRAHDILNGALMLEGGNIGSVDQSALLLAARKILLLYALFYVVYTISAIPVGILSDKVGRKPILMVAYLMFGVISVGLMFASNIYIVLIFFSIYGICYAMLDGVQRAFVSDLAPSHIKATALGVFHTAIGLVALPGGFMAGLLRDKIRPEATFVYGLILSVIALLLFTLVKTSAPAKQKEAAE